MLKTIDKIDVEKALKITAALIFILQIFFGLTNMVRAFSQPGPVTAEQLGAGAFFFLAHLVRALFEPLVLLALAKLITLKRGNDA